MSTLSMFRNKNKDEALLENSVLGRLARTHFRLVSPPQFSRKEPRQPLLKATPDDEKETVTKLWRVMTRFTGDAVDYRYGMDYSAQPYLGPIMTRLSRRWGLSTDDDKFPGSCSTDTPSDDGLPLKSLPNKPRGGTLRRLRDTLTVRLFKNKNETIFNSMPMEETLLTPLEHVHFIASCGILKPYIRDEIYCMICKHLVNNPYKTSTSRCWLLLELIIGCFPPSDQIYDSILAFIQERPPLYSTTLKKLLNNSARNGARFQPPSYREMDCYQQKKPIELQITLMDGTMQTVVADGTSTAQDIAERINDSLGLRHDFGYSIFISMLNKVASLGSGTDHVMDAVSQCEQLFREQGGCEGTAPWRLFYRKEMFSPWEDTSGDMIAISLSFAQIVRGIMLGEYTCDSDQELAVLAARQYFTEYGSEISEEGLQGVLPSYIPADRRQQPDSIKTWRRLVTKAHQRLFGNRKGREPSIDEVKLEVVQYAKSQWPMSFSKYYDVIKVEGPEWKETNVKLSINSSGVFVMASDKRLLQEISYPDIITIRGESMKPEEVGLYDIDDIVLFVLANGSFIKFESIDAIEIRRIVSGVINGLRMRSVWAVVREDANESTTETVNANAGDLIELSQPAGQDIFSKEICTGRNMSSCETGNIPTSILYVIPVMKKPSNDMLRLFRAPKRRSCIRHYLEDGSLQNLSNLINDDHTQGTGQVLSKPSPYTTLELHSLSTIQTVDDHINGNLNNDIKTHTSDVTNNTTKTPTNITYHNTVKTEDRTVTPDTLDMISSPYDDGKMRSVHFTSASPDIINRSPERSFNDAPSSINRSPESSFNDAPSSISRPPENSFSDAKSIINPSTESSFNDAQPIKNHPTESYYNDEPQSMNQSPERSIDVRSISNSMESPFKKPQLSLSLSPVRTFNDSPHPFGTRLVNIVNSVDCISAL